MMGDWQVFTTEAVAVAVVVVVVVAVAVPVAITTAVPVATAVPVVAGGTATGVGAMPPSVAPFPVPPLALPPVAIPYEEEATHAHVEGHSESVVQVVTLDWQVPGNEVVVVHTGAVVGAPASSEIVGGGVERSSDPLPPPVPDEVVPEPTALPPEEPDPQLPIVLGWHMKPSPQSVSALHGRSHL
jgi:hypothetical protein